VTGQAVAAEASQTLENQAEQAAQTQVSTERNNAVKIGSEKTGVPGELARWGGKAINGLRLVHVSRSVRHAQLREATTGRPVMGPVVVPAMVPKIWAVAQTASQPIAATQPAKPQPQVELAFYRKYTEAMLRRYLRVSMEVGRVPSVMGRELFRGNVSHYKVKGFEDGVIFSIDVERCLARLRKSNLRLIQRIALQGYSLQEAAPLLGLDFRRCHEQYGQALDQLTELFLAGRLLEPLKSCQDLETV
jgi:hypothetical protein